MSGAKTCRRGSYVETKKGFAEKEHLQVKSKKRKTVSRTACSGNKMSIKKSGQSRMTYYDFVGEAQKPISERKATVSGRNGAMRPIRRHHLEESSQSELLNKMAIEKRFISPYKAPGGYWGATEALSRLGVNEFHPIADVLKSMQDVMSSAETKDESGKTAWERFKDKRPRSRKNGLDWFGRVLQNLNVLQRIGGDDPYGLKLVQVGACVDLKADEHGSPMARLRTGIPKGEAVVPLNELKERNCARSVESVPSLISFSSPPGGAKRRRRSVESSAESKGAPSETFPVSESEAVPV